MIYPDISEIAAIFSDKSRSIILTSLLGGARTTTELSKAANIKPQTATFHLNKMVAVNLIVKEKLGKYSYYKIENEEVANLIETLMNLSKEPIINSLKESVQSDSIKFARLCFNHIGGKLGVALLDKLLKLNFVYIIEKNVILSNLGLSSLKTIGLIIPKESTTGFLCKDWSEKSYHLSGPLASSLYKNLYNLNLILLKENSREISLTTKGSNFLRDKLNLTF